MKKNNLSRPLAVLFVLLLFIVSAFTACESDDDTDGSKKSTITVDFESLTVPVEGYWNGSDGSGSFTDEDAVFSNVYDSDFATWNGAAYSIQTDKVTEGYANQYSVYADGGADSSKVFGIMYLSNDSYVSGAESNVISFSEPKSIKEISVCNTTYAYLSMKNGDSFAKKFGGDSGDDEDWFLLTVRAYDADGSLTGTVEFYLADFRPADNTKDYIIDEWTEVDLSSLGENVSTVSFELSSSDSSGSFGVNTPAYFAIDNLVYYK